MRTMLMAYGATGYTPPMDTAIKSRRRLRDPQHALCRSCLGARGVEERHAPPRLIAAQEHRFEPRHRGWIRRGSIGNRTVIYVHDHTEVALHLELRIGDRPSIALA